MARTVLKPKILKFIAEFLVDGHATNAAIRAGYAKANASLQASRLMRRDDVQAELERRRTALQKATGVTPDQVVAELARVGFSDVRLLFNERGDLRPMAEWPDDAARAVAGVEVEVIEEFDRESKSMVPVGKLKKIKLWPKTNALEQLSKHLGLFQKDNDQKVSPFTIIINAPNPDAFKPKGKVIDGECTTSKPAIT